MCAEARRKRSPALVVIPVIALLVGLLIAEGVTRLLHVAPPPPPEHGVNAADPWLPYMPRPFSVARGRSASGEFNFEYKHNSQGLRDIEHSASDSTLTILGLGDSFTFGIGAPFDSTYLAVLERNLNRRSGVHERVEIVKAGIPRFFPEPERIFLEHYGARYHPRIVLVGFVPNDIVDTHLGLDDVSVDEQGFLRSRQGRRLGSFGAGLYRHSALARVVLPEITMIMTRMAAPHADDLYVANGPFEKDWLEVENQFARMDSLANGMGAKLVIVHIPQRGPPDGRRLVPGFRLRLWARDHNIGFVDALPAIFDAESRGARLYWAKDGHCNSEGYAVIAGAIEQYLVEQSLVN
jgi:hypothetical protein